MTHRRALRACILLCMTASACGRDSGSAGTAASSRPGAPAREVHAVQVGAFTDSTLARRLADSLSMAGWQAYVSRADAEIPFRVRVAPSRSPLLAERVAFVLRTDSIDALAITDTAAIDPLVEAVRVNRGTHGMSSRVRWLLAPNGRALLVVHDPVGVEAEALPNGFVFASEKDGVLLQRDSVWAVAPSPSWTKLAYGQAFVMRAAEGDTITAEMWTATSARAGMPEDSVRLNAFLISGMSLVYSYSRPVVVDFEPSDSLRAILSEPFHSQPLPVSGGWRVQWTPDASQLALGDAPLRVQDDSPPRNWFTYDLASSEVRGAISPSRLAPLDWRLGPALDISIPIDPQASRDIRLEGASIVSRGGWIQRDGRVVGPGVPLAATRDGRFIAALVPRPDAKEYEYKLEPVVYRIIPGVR